MPLRMPGPYCCRIMLYYHARLPISRGLACTWYRGYPEGTATPPAVEMPPFRPYLGHLRRRYMLAVFSYSPRQPYLSPTATKNIVHEKRTISENRDSHRTSRPPQICAMGRVCCTWCLDLCTGSFYYVMTLFFPQSEDRENSATKHIYTLPVTF